jgi:phosphoglycerate dehydrogenase-like enzyme
MGHLLANQLINIMTTSSAIIVHPNFDHVWPWAADRLHEIWKKQGEVEFIRISPEKNGTASTAPTIKPAHTHLKNPATITRLVCFDVPFSEEGLPAMPKLREIHCSIPKDSSLPALFEKAGIRLIQHNSEGFWGQSVSEFGFALTLCGLRRIPQTHHRIITALNDWEYGQPDGIGKPGQRGHQFGDDTAFANGTLEGKRVRIVGAGNIGSRYASFCNFFGADVSMWDPFANEPCFHRAGARREHFLERLVSDAEIFAPMLPHTPKTEGLITKDHIEALPKGCLVVMVTRATICDCAPLYRRVLDGELALAADVFDHEPLEIGHALLGRPNVIHTPHNAGRTKESNWRFAEMLAEKFLPAGR